LSKCDFCGKEITLPFKCPFCTGRFCDEHRLPENHECLNAPPRSPLGHWKTKIPKGKEATVSEGDYHFIKESKEERKPRTRSRHIKKAMIALAIVVTVVLLGIIFIPSLITPHPRYYTLGEEMRGFPTEKVAITFTSWNVTKMFLFGMASGENATLVVFNFTLRNIADNQVEVYPNLLHYEGEPLRPRIPPLLKYGSYYADTHPVFAYYWGLWESTLILLPNQSVKGFIYYEILEGYEPTELVYPSKESPEIIVKIS